MASIMIDAGHYGKYNRSPAVTSYWESLMTWELHLYLKAELESMGVTVGTTRAVQANDLALMERGRKARGYDLFISLHSNAVGSSVNESIDYPVAYACVSGKADTIAQKLATCVQETMGTTQKGYVQHRYLDGGGDYYGVLRGAAQVGVPGLILEHSFHTQTRATKWLLSSDNLKKMARAEAKIIAKYLGKSVPDDPTPVVTSWYRIRKYWSDASTQVGAYLNKDLAIKNCPKGYCVFDSAGTAIYRNPADTGEETFTDYMVRVSISDLNIRKGPGTVYDKIGKYTGKGVFTIVEEADGPGADKWGLLKSYEKNKDGWISLDYVTKV